MRAPLVLLALAAPLLRIDEAGAAPCDCDHLLGLDATVVDGTALGVQPGESVCVRGGPRPYLRLQKFKGAEGQVIEIRNCEGQVDISNDDKGYALTIEQSSFVRLTGTGDDGFTHGFRARGAKDGPDYSAMSVAIGELSSDIEVDHVEAYEAGFAGFMVKTDPRCDGSANLGTFVMYNVSLHHNYIHDTVGEGIYFGSTGYGGREYTCDGKKVLLYPHEHHGVDIHDNVIEDTGWDGAQIGVSPKDCRFYRNTIKNVGLGGEMYQQQGLQIGGASACEVWGNVLMDGPTNGLFILGADDTLVYNNLIVGFKETGIYANDQGLALDARYRFAFNTVIASGKFGLAVYGDKLGPGLAYSNAIAGAGTGLLAVSGEVVDFVEMANQTADDPSTLGFVDVAARDFHLLADSPLRDAGLAAPELMITDDLAGTPRDGTPDVGAFEFDADPPGTDTDMSETGASDSGAATLTGGETGSGGESAGGESDDGGDPPTGGGGEDGGPGGSSGGPPTSGGAGEGSSGSGGESGSEASEGGCGCRSTNDGAPLWAGLGLLLLARRRR